MGSRPHLVIFDPDRAQKRESVCRRFGFQSRKRPGGGRWWQLPETELAAFRQAIEAITGEKIRFPKR